MNENLIDEKLKQLGANIERRRKELKISRNALAEKIGVSQNSISGYALGKQQPTFKTLCKLSDALEISLSELFGAELRTSQIEEIIAKERTKAVAEHQLGEAENIFSMIGWDFTQRDGKIALSRRKSLEEIEDMLTEDTKIKLLTFDYNETLISLARVVRDTALQVFNESTAAANLDKQLREKMK